MLYKTVVMELMEENGGLREKLRGEGNLLASLELLAGNLRERHRGLVAEMQGSRADGGFSEISSAALEIAVQEMRDRMTAFSDSDETIDLDQLLQEIVRRSPVG
ncbi:MAG: hypothetical protein KDA89_15610 [Planctomycetaceae bacterium]|nr:hypothetical protein [Planctomycetaceae bacterium]